MPFPSCCCFGVVILVVWSFFIFFFKGKIFLPWTGNTWNNDHVKMGWQCFNIILFSFFLPIAESSQKRFRIGSNPVVYLRSSILHLKQWPSKNTSQKHLLILLALWLILDFYPKIILASMLWANPWQRQGVHSLTGPSWVQFAIYF